MWQHGNFLFLRSTGATPKGDRPFLDRFDAAASDGFQAVEYLFPYAFAASDLAQRLSDHGLQQVLFNAPPGDWDGVFTLESK